MKKEKKFPKNTHILIISAKYGILGSYDIIEKYDQRMTEKRAKELKEEVDKKLEKFLKDKKFKEVFINVGKNYSVLLSDLEKFKSELSLKYATGKIGEKLSQTKEWIISNELKGV